MYLTYFVLVIGEVITNEAVARWLQKPPEQVTKILDMCTGRFVLPILFCPPLLSTLYRPSLLTSHY